VLCQVGKIYAFYVKQNYGTVCVMCYGASLEFLFFLCLLFIDCAFILFLYSRCTNDYLFSLRETAIREL